MNKPKLSVGIIDLNINNIFSIYQSCLKAGYKVEIIDLKKKKLKYDIIILPGVGAFKHGIKILKENHLNEKIYEYLLKPNSLIYGICLGMQLLFNKSYEFVTSEGLNLINGDVIKFHNSKKINKTHLGWNKFKIHNKDFSKIFKKFEKKNFYFVHSYHAKPKNKKNIFASTKYGATNFCSIIKKENIFGTQFHPEKSGIIGIEFLKNIKKLKN